MKLTQLLMILLIFDGVLAFSDEKIPDELQGVGITEHVGSKLNLGDSRVFKDESGNKVSLKDYFNHGKPVLFFLVYYECPNLCTFVLNAGVESLQKIDKTPGKDYEVVALSIDPRETPALALQKKKAYMDLYNRHEGDAGWHFLTGLQANITEVARELGFGYKWIESEKQFAHASAFFVLSPEAVITRYFYGIDYAPQDVKISILEASKGHLSSIVDKIILFCYHYDASTKRYVLLATRLMAAGGAATFIIMVSFFGSFWLRERKILKAQRG